MLLAPCSSPLISVIVISFNTVDLTRQCLKAVESALKDVSAEIMVVDNASTDGSVEMVRLEFPQTKLLVNTGNVGFGAANNQAMKQACGEYFLLLNSDALLHSGALEAMLQAVSRHQQAAVVAPQLLNRDGSLQRSCWRFPSPWRTWAEALWISGLFANHPFLGDFRAWKHDAERKVEWAIGACLLVRRRAYEQIGGFDESFFMYAEETDWQQRMTNAGWEIWFTPEAQVVHLGGASGLGIKRAIAGHFYKSNDLYLLRHHGALGLLSARIATAFGSAARALVLLLMEFFTPKNRAEIRSKRRLRCWLARRAVFSWDILLERRSSTLASTSAARPRITT